MHGIQCFLRPENLYHHQSKLEAQKLELHSEGYANDFEAMNEHHNACYHNRSTCNDGTNNRDHDIDCKKILRVTHTIHRGGAQYNAGKYHNPAEHQGNH